MISIWEQETFFAPQDVIIAGSGFAGLWSAFYLKRKAPNLKITVIDRALIPCGASTRNAGFACFGSLTELMYDVKILGVDGMLQLVEMRYRGLEKIIKHFGTCIDFELCGGYELFGDEQPYDLNGLETTAGYLNALLQPVLRIKNTFRLADDSIGSFGFSKTTHLVKNNLEGYLHPGKLLQALRQKVQSMGVQIINGIEIKSFKIAENKVTLQTPNTNNFITEKFLICTNAVANDLIPQAAITPARGQVIVTSPIKNLPFKGAFHADEGFYYFRNLGNKVLLGGARNKAFGEEQTIEATPSPFIQNELERYLAEVILPQHNGQYTIEHRWAGIMGMGIEKTPVVKEFQPNVFCAVGTGGMGVAVSPEMGKKAAKLLLH